MNMRNLILFLFLAVTANAQTIKDGSIVPRMLNIAAMGPTEIKNLQVYTSVSSNALTIGLYGADTGAAPTSLKPIEIMFRNSSNGTGNYVRRTITSSTTLTVPSGTTLGTANGVEAALWVYAIDNDGTVELGVSQFTIVDTSLPVSSTAISGGATAGVLYSTTARTSKPARLIAKILSTQTTAGTWATNPSTYQIGQFNTYVIPTIQRLTSGTAATYTTSNNVKYIMVTALGGGGGGGGSGTTTSGGSGGAGGNTTFGSSLLTANGGGGGQAWSVGAGGSGGTCTISSPAITIFSYTGGQGSVGNSTNNATSGGSGGASFFGSQGRGGSGNGAGQDAGANSGSGAGGGASSTASTYSGGGGAAGCALKALINNPSSTYTYTIGSGGTAGTAGTSGYAGGTGGAGIIIVEEYYQ